MSLLLRKGNHHGKVYCVVLEWWHRWYDDVKWLHHCWSPDQICGSSQWSPVDTSPPSAPPFNSLILLLSDQCHQRVILQPSTTSTHQSSERNRLLICAKIGRIGKAHQLFLTSQTCWTVGKCVCVYVRKCVCVCVVCDVIGVREKLALCLAAGWWTLNSIAQRHILSNRTLHNVTLLRGHHQLSLSNQISVYPLNFLTVSHFDLPFLFLLFRLQKIG